MTDVVASTGLLGKTVSMLKDMGKPPEMPETKIAPVADEAAKRAAKERESQRKYANTGRAGTMLSGESEKLG